MMNDNADAPRGAEHPHGAATNKAELKVHRQSATSVTARAVAQAIDPVCGMTVDPHTAKHRAEHAGQPMYFCSSSCRAKFMADPDKYLTKTKAPAVAVPEGTIYKIGRAHV